jgi:4-amino-4-deoxy-L-arabinose transferase-like glycosyltransferase
VNHSKRISRLALIFVLLTWIYILIRMPTFDYDESLFRRVADHMREKHDPWLLSWDGNTMFHKPPLFYWLEVAASFILDRGKETLSSVAARMPGFMSGLGILVSLHFGTRYITGSTSKIPASRSVLAFLCAAFPVLTASAVIFDPLQTLALMPSLLIPTRMFFQNSIPVLSEWLLMGLSIALAVAIKGLNGILIPGFALGVHLLLHIRSRGFKSCLSLAFQFLFFSIIPAVILATGYYLLLDRKIGSGFTHEFFWVQHFGRARNPMEAHSGGFLYHPLVLFFGGAFLTPLVLFQVFEKRPSYLKFGFPVTYALSFMLFFSLSATKLPHYTWPAWPALALFTGLLSTLPSPETPRSLHRRWGFLASAPVFLLGSLMLLLGMAPEILLNALNTGTEAKAVLQYLEPFGFFQKLLFVTGAFACFIFHVRRREWVKLPEWAALFASVTWLCLVMAITPTLERILVTPFQEVAQDLKSLNPAPGTCIRYSGPFSATLSLALGHELLHNRCEPGSARFLITPEWKANECENLQMQPIRHHSHLILCGK